MTIARRLPVGGATAFAATPPAPASFSLGASGYWSEIPEPRAVYYNGKTYIAWITEGGDVYVAAWDHTSETLSTPFHAGSGLSSPSGNIHNSVALLVRDSDKRILLAYCDEGDTVIRLRLSTNPEDVTAFDAQYTIISGGVYTYIALYQLTGVVNDPLYLFTRSFSGGTAYLAVTTSTDGGATWDSSAGNLVSPVGEVGNYWRIASNGVDRFDLFVTDNLRSDANPSSVYHMIYEGGALKESDGSAIAGALPRPATDGTLVHDDTDGPVRPGGWAYDGTDPAVLLQVYDAATTSNLVRVGRWTGSAWQVDEVASSDGIIASNRHVSGAAMAKDDPDTVYISRDAGSNFEMYRYTSPDGGTTWNGTALTVVSGADNANPETPWNAATGLRAIWGLGTYTSDSNFDFTLYGLE